MPYNVFILGSPNTVDRELSSISLNRVARAIGLQNTHPEMVILATGGFGSHFNTSTIPHRELIHQHLSRLGASINRASPDDLLSSNTVEDAMMILRFLASRGLDRCGIVTSEFHLARCRYIFECLAETVSVDFFTANDPASVDTEITSHEAIALAQLWAQGGVLVDNILFPHV
jgi:uncharacterized SAM-binding protein YcdF (DUF218 family)